MDATTHQVNLRAVLSNAGGNILEWYDFALYGMLAHYIARHFFPDKNAFVSIMVAYGVFAAGFFMRPLGGIVFGHFGDKIGRKKTLVASTIAIVVPTVLLGLVPGYETIGLTAAILIILIRLLQGFAIGGEFVGTISYMSEVSENKNRAFYTSFSMATIMVGIILGNLVILFTKALMSAAEFADWGWRIPFLFSFVLAYGVYFYRKSLVETEAFRQLSKEDKKIAPLVYSLVNHKAALVKIFGITLLIGAGFWIIIVYMNTYYRQVLSLPGIEPYLVNLMVIVSTMVLIPFFGKLADKIGKKTVMIMATLLFILGAYPLNILMVAKHNHLFTLLISNFNLSVILAMYLGAVPAMLAELIPTSTRFSGLALSYNLGIAVIGGLSPMIITYILMTKHYLAAPSMVLIIAAALSLVALLFIKEETHVVR